MGPDAYGITINPQGLAQAQAAAYCIRVREHLKWIERTKSGKILLNSIKYHGKPVEIRPYGGEFGACNAMAGTEQMLPSSLSGVLKAVATAGSSLTRGVVNYSPGTWSKHGPCRQGGVPKIAKLWDEVLFHELAHIFRFLSGKWDRRPLHTVMTHYDDNEEFFAVMLTNIYIADRSNKIKTGLRDGHIGGWPLTKNYTQPWGFYSMSSQVFDLVDRFCQDHKGLSKRMANDLADSEFNPLGDYYADREKARAISRAALKKDLEELVRIMTGWSF